MRLKTLLGSHERPYLLIWGCCFTLLTLIVGLGSWTQWRDYQDRERVVSFRTQLLANAVADFTASAMQQRQFAMDALADRLLTSAWPLNDTLVQGELTRVINSAPQHSPMWVAAGQRHWTSPGIAFNDLQWSPLQGDGGRIWLGARLQLNGEYWLPMFRRYQHPGGDCLIVGSLIPLRTQGDYLDSLRLNFDIPLGLIDPQGRIYLQQGRLPQALTPGEDGVQWQGEGQEGGVLLVRKAVPDYPLQVVIARWPDEYMALWYEQVRFILLAVVLSCMAITGASVGLVSAWRRIGGSERRYRRLFQSISDGVLLLGPSGIQEANDRAAELFGVCAKHLGSLQFLELCTPDQLNKHSAATLVVPLLLDAANGTELCATLKFRRLDQDQVFFCEVRFSSILLGRQVYILACLHDMSAYRRAEEALQVSQQKLLEAQLIAGLGVWSWEVGAGQATWTDECARIFGLPALSGACTYKDFFNSIHPEQWPYAKQAFNQALNGERLDIEVQIRRPDGHVRDVVICGELRPHDDKPLLLGALFDITAQKRVEQRLSEGERHYRGLVELLPEGLLIHCNSRVVFANLAASKLFAADSVEQLVGLNIFQLVSSGFHHQLMDDLTLVLRPSHLPKFVSRHYRRLDGTDIEVEVAAQTLLMHGEVCVQVMLRDVREHRRLQSDLEEANARLQRLSGQVLEVQEVERRRIARELHDDVGQLLTFIKISASGIQRHLTGEIEQRQAVLVQIADEALSKVRDLSRMLRPAQLDSLGLVAAMQWQIEHYLPDLSDGVRCRLECTDVLPRLSACVEITFFRIFQEALSNVLKHAGAQQVKINLSRQDDFTHLSIHDDGSGFDYAAALSAGKGMGLLSMAERAKLLGGTFVLRSTPEQGTEILVSIQDQNNNGWEIAQ